MNILITGANGFIGRSLSRYLNKKYNVFNLISKANGVDISNPIAIDLTDHSQVITYFKRFKNKHKIDVVLHLATKFVDTKNINDMDLLYYNLKIAENICIVASLLKPKKIINFSSIAVYPNKDGIYNEISEIKPSINTDCLYGLSKFCSENILDFMLRNENIIISHLRISQVYGDNMRKDRVVPMMLKELKKKNTITIFGEGERISNFIRIGKLLKITEIFIDEDVNGIYNIGEEDLSYLELAQRLIQQYGNGKSRIIKKEKGLKAKFCLDIQKLKKVAKCR